MKIIYSVAIVIMVLWHPVILAKEQSSLIMLPKVRLKGQISVEEAIKRRESVRSYRDAPISLSMLSQLLWAAQGITREGGGRSAPSAGATYPLTIYVAVGNVTGLEPGFYRYLPREHGLEQISKQDIRYELALASLMQLWMAKAPVVLIVAANYERTTSRYGERGIRYVHIEVGAVCENVHLQAVALDLGTVIVGAFEDESVKKILQVKEEPLALMPVGRIAR